MLMKIRIELNKIFNGKKLNLIKYKHMQNQNKN